MDSTKPSRNIILHAHIFKNAGTSVDNILHHNFNTAFIDHRDPDQLAAGKQAYLNEFFHQNPQIVAFASHHLPLPLQAPPDFSYFIIMMLRHPIIRAASAYRFERRQEVDNGSANAAKRYGFADYVRWHMDRGSHMFLNYFIRYCTSSVVEPLTDEMRLKYALADSDYFSILGVVEQFDQSMTLLKNNLAKHQINISLIQSKKNVTDTSTNTLEEKLARIETELGEQLYTLLLEQNKEDMLFYEHARQCLNTAEYE